jgi:PHS family inorganic phosphate transporter-like MFS transporter
MGKSNFIGQMANFSIQYSLSVLSVALTFMGSHSDTLIADDDHVTQPDFPEPKWTSTILRGMVFAGTIVGMTSLGVVGDVFGRRAGMLASLTLVIAGSLAAGLLSWGAPETIYTIICVCRLVIGVGVG